MFRYGNRLYGSLSDQLCGGLRGVAVQTSMPVRQYRQLPPPPTPPPPAKVLTVVRWYVRRKAVLCPQGQGQPQDQEKSSSGYLLSCVSVLRPRRLRSQDHYLFQSSAQRRGRRFAVASRPRRPALLSPARRSGTRPLALSALPNPRPSPLPGPSGLCGKGVRAAVAGDRRRREDVRPAELWLLRRHVAREEGLDFVVADV